MKGKAGPSFFDVLRTTMKLELNPEVAEEKPAPPAPPPPRVMLTPPLTPVPNFCARPAVEPTPRVEPPPPVEESSDPDRRAFAVSQTAALFGGLVALITLLGAFYFGVRVGRASESSAAPGTSRPVRATSVSEQPVAPMPQPSVPAPDAAPAPAPAPTPKFTIHVMSWPARNRAEKDRAQNNATYFANFLSEKGFQDLKAVSSADQITLYMGQFATNTDAAARKVLDALRGVQYASGSTPARTIFRGSDFVAVSLRQP